MEKIPSINGLRAVSICIVIAGHCVGNSHIDSLNNFFYSTFGTLFQMWIDSAFGVNVFFVISGFLITLLLLKEEAQYGKIDIKSFYLRRIIRIFPALYLLLLFYFILQTAGVIHLSKMSWLTSLTYTKFLWHEDWETGHLWSLGFEEWFYFLWPLFFISLKNRKYRICFLCIVALGPMARWVDSRLFSRDANSFLHFIELMDRANTLIIGCLLALCKDDIVRFLKQRWKIYFGIALLLLVALPYVYKISSSLDFKFIAVYKGVRMGFVGNILISVILFYSIYVPKGYWYRILNTPIMDYIGKLSYSLYLWQQFFLMNNKRIWATQYPQNCIFIIMTVLLSYYCVEKPFLKLKMRFTHKTT